MRLLDLLKVNNLLDNISFKYTSMYSLEAIDISDVEFLLFTNDDGDSCYCRYDVIYKKTDIFLKNICVNKFVEELEKVIYNEQEKFNKTFKKNLLLEQLKKK